MNEIKKFSREELEKAGIPKDIQWVITNTCDLQFKGGYCTVPHSKMPELINGGLGDIYEIIDTLAIMGLEVKILGGNISDRRQTFLSIVERMNKRDITYAIADNAMNKETILEAVNKYGVNGFVFSLDTLSSLPQYRNFSDSLSRVDMGGCSPIKSAATLELIPKIRSKVPYIAVNTVIHAGNIGQIVPIVEYCTGELDGVIVNLCPMIHGSLLDEQGENLFIYRGSTDSVAPYVLQPEHKLQFVELMNELIEMKESGYLIGAPIEYLELMRDNSCESCEKFTWNCSEFESCPILRLFPNGRFGVCSDLLGRDMQRAELTPDLLLREEGWEKINQAWLNDRDRMLCCARGGCLWSNIIISEIYREKRYGTITATAKNL